MDRAPRYLTLAVFLAGTASAAAETLDDPAKSYLNRFAVESPFTGIIEYVSDDYSRVEGQRIFSSAQPFASGGGATIKFGGITVNLYGVSACPSDAPIQVFIYQGPCNGALPQYIDTELSLSPIVICRAFKKYAELAVQDATCWSLYTVGDAAIVHNVEEALLKVGAGIATRRDDGSLLRPDLADAEMFARKKESLLWNPAAAAALGDLK